MSLIGIIRSGDYKGVKRKLLALSTEWLPEPLRTIVRTFITGRGEALLRAAMAVGVTSYKANGKMDEAAEAVLAVLKTQGIEAVAAEAMDAIRLHLMKGA